jgi:hypothetical protein
MGYESKATVTKISATSRVAVKIRDNFYTIEYSEERSIPDVEGVDMDKERQMLFDDVNATVDDQVEDIVKSFKK